MESGQLVQKFKCVTHIHRAAHSDMQPAFGRYLRSAKQWLIGDYICPSVRDLVSATKGFMGFPLNSVSRFFRKPCRREVISLKIDTGPAMLYLQE